MTDKSAWAVSSGEYSDYSVSAVFATKELAEQAAADANENRAQYADKYEVEEFPYFDRPARMRIRYEHDLLSGGSESERQEVVPEWNGWGQDIQGFTWDFHRNVPYSIVVRVTGYDKERVDKAFSERVAQYHASQPMRRSLEAAVALLDLPSWEHVGAELLSHGITDGEQENCELCPIAEFLLTAAKLRCVSVGATMAFPHRYNAKGGVELPPAAVEFIRWFDDFGRA